MSESIPSRKETRSDFEKKKASYFSKFALAHISEMRILKEGGVLGKENADWRNVSEHCLVEAVGADILAEHLGANRKEVVQGTLLHDWYKRHEIENRREHGSAKGFAISSAEDIALLREHGIPGESIRIAHANVPDSDDPLYLHNRPLEDKILHYIDMITDQSTFIDPEERLRKAETNTKTMEFLESFREKFHGKHLNELQREVLKLEQTEFEEKIGLEKGKLISFLNDEMQKRIESVTP